MDACSEPGQVKTERSVCDGCGGDLWRFNGKPAFCDPCIERAKAAKKGRAA